MVFMEFFTGGVSFLFMVLYTNLDLLRFVEVYLDKGWSYIILVVYGFFGFGGD